jgi:hypothetical protein
MINWDEIKNNIGELNGNNILSPIDNKPLNNELIMCLFCNKINLKYRFEPYYEIHFIEYNTRIFNTVISGFYENNNSTSSSNKNFKNNDIEYKNFFDVVKKEKMITTYILSIKNIIITQIKIATKSEPDKIKKLINEQNINNIDIYDYITNKFDINLILVSALDNMDLIKYKILSEMLYNIDNKYLDYAKESIINSNKNMSLDEMVYGFNLPTKTDIEMFANNSIILYINYLLIILIIIILILIFSSLHT